jgi:hypothetical protein
MFYDCYVTIEITTMNIKSFIHRYLYLLITPYIRMLHSEWLVAVIFFLQIQALHCEFAEFLLHVGVFA